MSTVSDGDGCQFATSLQFRTVHTQFYIQCFPQHQCQLSAQRCCGSIYYLYMAGVCINSCVSYLPNQGECWAANFICLFPRGFSSCGKSFNYERFSFSYFSLSLPSNEGGLHTTAVRVSSKLIAIKSHPEATHALLLSFAAIFYLSCRGTLWHLSHVICWSPE